MFKDNGYLQRCIKTALHFKQCNERDNEVDEEQWCNL